VGLDRALVDRARRVYNREDPTGAWREGQPKGEEALGAWVPVRMRRQDESEADNQVRVQEQGGLLIALYYEDGITPTYEGARFSAWDADDMVEVEYEGSTERWYVASGVRPLRRREGFVGFRCSLRQAREASVTEEELADPDLVVLGPAGEHAPPRGDLPVVADDFKWEGG
jgi:hypothetical protein